MKNLQIPSRHSAIANEDLIFKLIEKYARPASEVILDNVDLCNLLRPPVALVLSIGKKAFLNSINWMARFFIN